MALRAWKRRFSIVPTGGAGERAAPCAGGAGGARQNPRGCKGEDRERRRRGPAAGATAIDVVRARCGIRAGGRRADLEVEDGLAVHERGRGGGGRRRRSQEVLRARARIDVGATERPRLQRGPVVVLVTRPARRAGAAEGGGALLALREEEPRLHDLVAQERRHPDGAQPVDARRPLRRARTEAVDVAAPAGRDEHLQDHVRVRRDVVDRLELAVHLDARQTVTDDGELGDLRPRERAEHLLDRFHSAFEDTRAWRRLILRARPPHAREGAPYPDTLLLD